jgi:nucleoside phosphorylase/CheY-like chemotaxis protein
MINLLIVDDSQVKVGHLVDFLSLFSTPEQLRIEAVGNVYEAAQALRGRVYDLLILDLNIPLRAGEPPRDEGGVRLLRAIQTRPDIKRPDHIVGLTAFDTLRAKHAGDFDEYLWTIVHYDPAQEDWLHRIGRKVVHIMQRGTDPSADYGVDLCLLTAMHSVELEAVLDLPCEWHAQAQGRDSTIYHKGKICNKVDVVAASANEVGMPSAAALAMKMISTFRPRYIGMVGIAAGVAGNFGDILVGDQSWDYGSGKLRKQKGTSIFSPSPQAYALDPILKSRFQLFSLDRSIAKQIFDDWDRDRPSEQPAVRIGTIASGAAVIADGKRLEEIATADRKVVGVEMEAYSVFVAARLAPEPRPLPFVVKSICDFGDKNKNDDYQRYAAFTSARYVHAFAEEYLDS